MNTKVRVVTAVAALALVSGCGVFKGSGGIEQVLGVATIKLADLLKRLVAESKKK